MLKRFSHRFLRRLAAPTDTTERLRVERVLASARCFLILTAMIAVYLDETEPNRYAELAYAILAGYFLWSLIVWAHAHRAESIANFPKFVHVFDVAFPITFMLFTAGPNSPFFVFLLFVMTAASFRWGFPETMLTSSTVTALLIVEAALLGYGQGRGWIAGQYEINRFVIRISYLLTLGALVGYLGEEDKQWRAENSTINRLLAKIHAENGLRASMQEIFSEATRIFQSPRALVVLIQTSTDQIYLWRTDAGGVVHSSEVEVTARERYQFGLPADALFAYKRGSDWKCWAMSKESRKTKLPAPFDLSTVPEVNGAKSLLATSIAIGEEWSGCLLLFDAVVGPSPEAELRFMQTLMRQIGPALYTVFLVRRLRSRAGAIERARVARELHDGTIQALISVEMQIDVLRRRLLTTDNAANVASDLEPVQELLRTQVFELRMLMQQMRPLEFRPGQLLDYMADMVDRFRRDTGISAQFVTSLEEIQIPSRIARELARILQEALVNVRKHSGATNVHVRFAAEEGCWKLGIVDNGRGFDFSGRLTLKELDSARRGPGVIKERVRSLAGDLTLQSTPSGGTELEISLPQKAQSTYV